MNPILTLRTFLFVPGDDPTKLRHAAASGADALVVDWEDAVLPQRKPFARDGYCGFSQSGCKKPIFLRINSFRSSWFEEDVRVAAGARVDGIVLPKCESAGEILRLVDGLQRVGGSGNVAICPMIESPAGMLRSEEIATASERVAALGLGAQDFCSTMGMRLSQGESEMLVARCSVVTVARAYGVAAIDSPSVELHDPRAVRDQADRSASLGFTGKFAIHPNQLQPIAEAFAPTAEELKNAREILEQARIREVGAFAWNGQMIDEAVLERARGTLRRVRSTD